MRWVMDGIVGVIAIGAVIVTIQAFSREPPPALPPPPPEEASAPPSAIAEETSSTDQERLQELEWRNRELERKNAEMLAETERRNEEQLRRLQEQGLRQRLQVPSDPGSGYVERGATSPASEPRTSEIDQKRQKARGQLASLFGTIGPAAKKLFQDVENYRRTCGNETQGQCRLLLENIGRQAIGISRYLAAAQELARTSWLPPGEVRELRERHGLDDGGWDRLVSLVNRYAR